MNQAPSPENPDDQYNDSSSHPEQDADSIFEESSIEGVYNNDASASSPAIKPITPVSIVELPQLEKEVLMPAGEQIEAPAATTWYGTAKKLFIGNPRDLADKSVFTHMSLVAFLAWVGLGADGLSSSCYGPAEAFGALGEHRFLAIPLALAIIATVFIICICYSHIIEAFPSGGGGYLVASKLLHPNIGVVSGCAILVDYVLTITVSIAVAGDAFFGLLPDALGPYKIGTEVAVIVFLIILNLRGVKESIQLLLPIFIIFLITHTVLIVGVIAVNFSSTADISQQLVADYHQSFNDPNYGLMGMLASLMFAYSLGAGTYTGLEAVSDSLTVLREPRVATGKRTMRYMAYSLSFMAGGLILSYLLLNIPHSVEPPMNYFLTSAWLHEIGLGNHWSGSTFLWITMLSESALLFVAAQTGFIDGPRVLSYMAHDSWVPRWFGQLSERLAMHNGVLLLGVVAILALVYTQGNIQVLIVMYSTNVFVTFSLSMIGMCRHWYQQRKSNPLWFRRLLLFIGGSILCVSILLVSIWEKFFLGAWLTLLVTGSFVCLCFLIRRNYIKVGISLKKLDESLGQLAIGGDVNTEELDPTKPMAVILVGRYSGLGIHTMLNAIRFAPDHFGGFIFISTGIIGSGIFKGAGTMDSLKKSIEGSLNQYVDLARGLGLPAKSYMSIGTDAVDELERICLQVSHDYPKSTFFAGQLIFRNDNWFHRLLHNQTAFSLQRRLHWAGFPMVILPTRVRD